VRRSDGVWRVVEVGDGQVRDRSAATNADLFMTAILAQLLELLRNPKRRQSQSPNADKPWPRASPTVTLG
jgi:hypothetical protein